MERVFLESEFLFTDNRRGTAGSNKKIHRDTGKQRKMKKNKAYKYRIYPDEEQKNFINQTIGCARFIYNKMLEDKIKYYKENGKMLINTPAQYKKEFPFLKDADSLALANAQQNLQSAFKNFFENPKTGFPKFKSKHRSRKSYTTNNQKGTVAVENGYIVVEQIICGSISHIKCG